MSRAERHQMAYSLVLDKTEGAAIIFHAFVKTDLKISTVKRLFK